MITRDLQGQLVLPGRVQRTITEHFLTATALPAWLTAGAGTPSFSLPGASYGYCQMTTGAVLNNQARLDTIDIDTSKFRAVLWELQGLTYQTADNTMSVSFGIYAGAVGGCQLMHDFSVDAQARLRTHNPSNDTPIPYDLKAAATSRRNLSMLLLPQDKEVYVLEDDQVIWAQDVGATLLNGIVKARADVTTKTAATRWLRVSQVKLTLVHN